MNRVWMATLRISEAKQRLVETSELKDKNSGCIVIDPSCSEVYVSLSIGCHSTCRTKLFGNVLGPFSKIIEVSRGKWRLSGLERIESTTRILGATSHQTECPTSFRVFNALIIITGRATVHLPCKRTGHIRRDGRVPRRSEWICYGHKKKNA